MLQESQIKGGADGVCFSLRKNNVTTVVALLDGAQNVFGIVLSIAITLDRAGLLPRR